MRFIRLSRIERPNGSRLAFAQNDFAYWLNPYPFHYKTAFASSILPYPQLHRLTLRFAFPCGEVTGLSRSAYITKDDLGSACPPVDLMSTTRRRGIFLYLTTCLLAQAYQRF